MHKCQAADIPVYLAQQRDTFTGKTTADYRRMIALGPYGVVVDDVAKFQRWRDSVSGT